MFIAQDLRKKNIAEYILYMWQVEDIIRAYDCNLTKISREYIEKFDNSREEKEEMADWYGNLIRMMNQEGCREKGHLQINNILIRDLNELHQQLLQSSQFPFYNAEYYRVLPFVVELRNKSDKEACEIETCLNALYGTIMLKLQKKEISTETNHAIKEISTFMGMLSDYYLEDKTKGLKFE